MPNSISLVNQKLAYARSLMAAVDVLGEPGNARQRLDAQALLDATAFHLLCAYRHYLRELAEGYMVPAVASINSEDDLLSALAALGKTPNEATELKNLSRDSNSWLAQLQGCYQACWQLPGEPSPASVGRIALVDLDKPVASDPVITAGRLREWYTEFNQLIARQRESSVEY